MPWSFTGACAGPATAATSYAFTYAPTAGNTLVVGVATAGASTIYSLGAVATFTVLAQRINSGLYRTLYAAFNVPAGVTGVTIGSSQTFGCLAEFSGVASLDVANSAYDGAYDSSWATGAITPTQDAELLVAMAASDTDRAFLTPTNGFTAPSVLSSQQNVALVYLPTPATAGSTYSTVIPPTSGGNGWGAIAGLTTAAGGGGGARALMLLGCGC